MITVQGKGLAGLAKATNGVAKDLKKNIAIAINDTSRFCQSQIAKEIQGSGIKVPQKVIKTGIINSGRANAAKPSVKVTLKKGYRFGLNAFNARQTKKGVSYTISKNSGVQKVPGAFVVKAWSKKVYIRKSKGKGSGRGPLRQLRAISPWGVFVKNKKTSVVSDKTQTELSKQIDRRIRFLLLKAQGKI